MRTTPMIGKKLWFRPRGWGGWGWYPASWEGWVVIASYAAVVFASSRLLADERGLFTVVSALATFIALTGCVLKGTAPGGPRRLEEFRRLTADRELARRVRRSTVEEPDLAVAAARLRRDNQKRSKG